jgi:2-polyprenyl-3-methyl-5-hydroxy-6-metoxy-1,4-benzoquinol methylase
VTQVTHQEYLDYLVRTYGERPDSYYQQFLRTPVHAGSAVLDWGCGLGRMLEVVERFSPARLAGLDLNPECVRHVRERHPDWDVALLAEPGLACDFPDGSFDRVLLIDVLEHASDPMALLRECHRILKPHGILTLSTPDRLSFHKLPGRHPASAGNLAFNLKRAFGRAWIDPTHRVEWTAWGLRGVLAASPFGDADFRPVFWHRIPWIRPPKRHYAFIVDLVKRPGASTSGT